MHATTRLLDRRILIVSGKGGVGRTTVAAVLARAAVRAGKRVLLAQMDSPERLSRLLGHPGVIGPEVTAVSSDLDAVNMTPARALRQYGLMVFKVPALYRALFENRAMQGFLAAVPGLDAYAMLGKVWWHTGEQAAGRNKYDLVILDGPASGHTATMLEIPDAILKAMPKGPLSRDARAMQELLRNPARTAFVIVTLPEELPAREAAELAARVRGILKIPFGPLLVNGMPPAAVAHPLLREVLDRVGDGTGDSRIDATLAGAAVLAAQRREAEVVLQTLRSDPGLAMVELPRLPTTDLGPAEIDELADVLGASPVLR